MRRWLHPPFVITGLLVLGALVACGAPLGAPDPGPAGAARASATPTTLTAETSVWGRVPAQCA